MIKQQEAGEKIVDMCRRSGIGQGIIKKHKFFGGVELSDAKSRCALEAKNTKLNALLAAQRRENAMRRGVTPKSGHARC